MLFTQPHRAPEGPLRPGQLPRRARRAATIPRPRRPRCARPRRRSAWTRAASRCWAGSPDYHTRTGFRVTPVVGLVAPPFELRPDAREVDEVFEVPLAFLLDPANHQRHAREFQGRQVRLLRHRLPRAHHLGRHRRDAGESLPVPRRRADAGMSVLAIIAALVLEQWRPLGERKAVRRALGAWVDWLERSFNGGEARHGTVAWLVAVLPPVVVRGRAAYALLLCGAARSLALAFNVARALPDARLPPVQPLLHRPPARDQGRRHRARARAARRLARRLGRGAQRARR